MSMSNYFNKWNGLIKLERINNLEKALNDRGERS